MVARAKVEMALEVVIVICPAVPWRVNEAAWKLLMVVVAGAEVR